MKPSVWFGYLFGRGAAIRELAENRATIWTGIGLVLLTSIARNYDQTFIAEKPFLWLFGSLIFSLVSGTWLYCVLYGWLVRRAVADADGNKPEFLGRWRSFMGLFWMTSPVAWLYAIPVERFFDSLTAAKANLTLLAIVSLWRVLLMTRVIQFLSGVHAFIVLLWVLFAAGVEILVVFFFGGAFAKALMSGMGGMRNSPEETLIVQSLSAVFGVVFWVTPVVLILAAVIGRNSSGTDFPTPKRSEFRVGWLVMFALLWLAAAVLPQIELSRNVQLEKLFRAGKHREALDYLAARQPTEFAPSRVLPPNAFEWEIFTELPECFGVVQTNDPPRVRAHLMQRLDQMCSHYAPRWERKKSWDSYPNEEQVKRVHHGLNWHGPDAARMILLLDGLERLPEGRRWLAEKPSFVEGVRAAIASDSFNRRTKNITEAQQINSLLTLSNRFPQMGVTNAGELSPSP